MTTRIGFCCKWLDRPDQVNGLKPKDDAKQYTDQGTTVAWLNRQSRDVAEQKLWDIMVYNIDAVHRLIKKVGEQDAGLRMVRLSSNLLPVYTEPTYSYFWLKKDVRDYCEKAFAVVGATAKALDVRLSMHPGQFVVLASDSEDIVRRSIEEFEYHTDIIRWMGYGREFQDFKCNVHISGRQGPAGIRAALNKLSPEARNCITVENEEYKHGLDDCLSLADVVPTVLDVHHHWIRDGNYIAPDDVRIGRILDSWRGVRPVLHYSVSRQDLFCKPGMVLESVRPVMDHLLANGYNKGKLRAHSDFYWNSAMNDYVLSFADRFDIQCESKGKNLASFALHAYQNLQNNT
jgi:UV DNA damage repair endonuclease